MIINENIEKIDETQSNLRICMEDFNFWIFCYSNASTFLTTLFHWTPQTLRQVQSKAVVPSSCLPVK